MTVLYTSLISNYILCKLHAKHRKLYAHSLCSFDCDLCKNSIEGMLHSKSDIRITKVAMQKSLNISLMEIYLSLTTKCCVVVKISTGVGMLHGEVGT